MAISGALGEGWSYAYGPRNGEYFFRGQVSVTSAASVVVTVPLPIRLALFPVATLVATTAPTVIQLTVGTISNNTFTIYAWQATSGTPDTFPLVAATGDWVADWMCFGNLLGVTPVQDQA